MEILDQYCECKFMCLGINDALAFWYNGIAEKYQYMGESSGT